MRYRLRTLMILLAVGPPLLACSYWGLGKYREWQERKEWEQATKEMTPHLDTIANQMEALGGGLRTVSREESARIKAMLEVPAE